MLELKIADSLVKLFALEKLPVTFEVVKMVKPVRANAISVRFGPSEPLYFFRRRTHWYVFAPDQTDFISAPTALGIRTWDTVFSLAVVVLQMLVHELRAALYPVRGIHYFQSTEAPQLTRDERMELGKVFAATRRLLTGISASKNSLAAGLAKLELAQQQDLIDGFKSSS